jgi:hypothetical protein
VQACHAKADDDGVGGGSRERNRSELVSTLIVANAPVVVCGALLSGRQDRRNNSRLLEKFDRIADFHNTCVHGLDSQNRIFRVGSVATSILVSQH